MSPSLFCATTMATVYREVYVTHDGPSLQHFQPSHHDFSCMEAAAEAAACISGSWERAAVKVQAVYWWSVKRTRQKRRTRTRKTGKNKPRGLQSRQWCERSWAGYVLIGPLCKQRRCFPLCGVILSEQFSSSSSSSGVGPPQPQHHRNIFGPHVQSRGPKRLRNSPNPQPGPGLGPPDCFPRGPKQNNHAGNTGKPTYASDTSIIFTSQYDLDWPARFVNMNQALSYRLSHVFKKNKKNKKNTRAGV